MVSYYSKLINITFLLFIHKCCYSGLSSDVSEIRLKVMLLHDSGKFDDLIQYFKIIEKQYGTDLNIFNLNVFYLIYIYISKVH